MDLIQIEIKKKLNYFPKTGKEGSLAGFIKNENGLKIGEGN
jgi:hypothetical protein